LVRRRRRRLPLQFWLPIQLRLALLRLLWPQARWLLLQLVQRRHSQPSRLRQRRARRPWLLLQQLVRRRLLRLRQLVLQRLLLLRLVRRRRRRLPLRFWLPLQLRLALVRLLWPPARRLLLQLVQRRHPQPCRLRQWRARRPWLLLQQLVRRRWLRLRQLVLQRLLLLRRV
jgi:hypothetical protein